MFNCFYKILKIPKKIRDWEFCSRAKTGSRIIQEFGTNIPKEYQAAVLWAQNNQSKINFIKTKYSWNMIPHSWRGSLIEGIHVVLDTRHKEIFLKGYLHLYSVMNWGTHGSGTIIQSIFPPDEVDALIIKSQYMISCSALMTMTSILSHPKIKFWGGDITHKCLILSEYMSTAS